MLTGAQGCQLAKTALGQASTLGGSLAPAQSVPEATTPQLVPSMSSGQGGTETSYWIPGPGQLVKLP